MPYDEPKNRSIWPEVNLARWSLWAGAISLATLVIGAGRNELTVFVAFATGLLACISSILALAVLALTRRSGYRAPLAGGVLGGIAVFAIIYFTPDIRAASNRMKSANNLKQILWAMDNYDGTYKQFPQTIRDRDGRPLLSFRVAILPFVEEEDLYRRFHLGEPWDSPHNLSLIDPMPSVYRSPGDQPPQPTWTFYRLVTGRDTALERPGTLDDLRGRLSGSVFVLEAGEAVPWTKPEEWEYDPDQPLPAVGGIFNGPRWWRRSSPNGTNVAFGDGHVKFLPRNTPEAVWRALIERDGNKNIELP
jgi:prepilin-type processing-associated H-X9-DG protein